MELTSKDIDWYKHSLSGPESKEVIFSYGEFPNMPLMRMRGGINYNPTLSRRQLGFALKGPLEDKYVQESMFYDVPNSIGWMERAAKACGSIHLKGGAYFGKRDSTIYSPYAKWIEDMNKDRH